MSESRIVRKDLWQKLANLRSRDDWIRAADALGLVVTRPKGGSSHYAIRFPGFENWDTRGLISVVYDPLRKDISESIFKKLLNKGFKEDDIWRALKMLKDEPITDEQVSISGHN